MSFFPSILLVGSKSASSAIYKIEAGASSIAEIDQTTSLDEALAICQDKNYAAYLVEQLWLEAFITSLPTNHPPVIALVDNLEAGQQALALGADDYLEEDDLTISTIARSLRLTITAHQRLRESQEKEQKLQQLIVHNEAKYEGIFNLLPRAVVLVFDHELRVLFAKGKALKNLYLSSENLEGKLLKEVASTPENFTLLEKHYQAVFTGASPIFEIIVQECCYLIYTSPIKDELGNVTNCLAVAYDVTERKYTEQALKSSEAKFRAIFERSPMGIALVSIERKIFQVNANFCEILGYTEAELIGVGARSITHPDDLEVTDGNINYLLNKEGNYFTLEKRYLCRNGSYCWVQSAVAAVRDAQGDLQYMVLLITDIQERKQVEEQIEYRLHLESIVTTISQHLLSSEAANLNWLIEILGKSVECDRAYINRFTHDLKYFTITHLWHNKSSKSSSNYHKTISVTDYPEWFDTLRCNQDVLMNNIHDLPPSPEKIYHAQNRTAACLEVPIFSSQGQLWISLCFESITPRSWLPEDAQILRLVGEMICGYYEKLNSQKELKASESLYSSIFNHSIDNIFLLQISYPSDSVDKKPSKDGKNIKFTYKTINPAHEKVLGISTAEIVGKTPAEILAPAIANWVESQYLLCVQNGEVMTYEESIPFKEEVYYFVTTLVPIKDELTGQITKIQGSSRDITQMKLAEQEILDQVLYQRLIFSLTLKVRESLEPSKIIETTVEELQKVLPVDRILIWQFHGDRRGESAGESCREGLQNLDPTYYNPHPMPLEMFQQFQQGQPLQVANLDAFDLSPSYREFLQHHQIKSFLTLPILLTVDRPSPRNPQEQTQTLEAPILWGLLSLFQCQDSKIWETWEVEQLQLMTSRIGMAIYQAQLLEQERRHTKELAAYNAELT